MRKIILGGIMLIGLAAAAQQPVQAITSQQVKDSTKTDVRRYVHSDDTSTTVTVTKRGYRKRLPSGAIKDTMVTTKVYVADTKKTDIPKSR